MSERDEHQLGVRPGELFDALEIAKRTAEDEAPETTATRAAEIQAKAIREGQVLRREDGIIIGADNKIPKQ